MYNNNIYVLFYFVAIIVNFNQSTYRILEHEGLVQPVLNLSKPSPCCLRVSVKLMDITAIGELMCL